MTLRRFLCCLIASVAIMSSYGPVAQAQQVGPESPICLARTRPPSVGLRLLSEERSGRVVHLRLLSKAMGKEARFGGPGEQPVNVLLPVNYDGSGRRRYPVVYLLHGFSGSYAWDLPVESIVGRRQVILVMPDDGYNGAYTDWYGRVAGDPTPGEPPAWETYHLKELVPFIDRHFPTLGTREGRAIAGISSGGGGAMKYAARRPDLFVAAGSMSGALNITQDYPIYPSVDLGLNSTSLVPGTASPSHCKFGDPYTQQVVWENSNPFYLASNLRGVSLWLTSGDGGDGVEDYIRRMNEWFVAKLDRLHLPYTNTFRPGTHSAPLWIEDLKRFLPWVMQRFEHPSPRPRMFSYRGMSYDLRPWGWRFEHPKRVKEFTYIDNVSAGGFTVTGGGGLFVRTAGLYAPGARYVVEGAAGGGPVMIRAGSDRSLAFEVDLGQDHETQQYRFECACWNDMDSRSGLVDLFGDDPEMRDRWVTRIVRIRRLIGRPS